MNSHDVLILAAWVLIPLLGLSALCYVVLGFLKLRTTLRVLRLKVYVKQSEVENTQDAVARIDSAMRF